MARYVVIEVGCLECQSGDATPEIVMQTDDFEEARASVLEKRWSGDADRFIFDQFESKIIARAEGE